MGLTQNDGLKIILGVGDVRIQANPNQYCIAAVTVEVLDAITHTVLATYGPRNISPTSAFSANFLTDPGRPPARREVVVTAKVERKPRRDVEPGIIPLICPLTGSIQIFDVATGRTNYGTGGGWDVIALDGSTTP